jgi:hypothetical protein
MPRLAAITCRVALENWRRWDFAQVMVEEEDIALARKVIEEYEAENYEKPDRPHNSVSIRSVLGFVFFLLILIAILATIQ